jgi:hypothetical protein
MRAPPYLFLVLGLLVAGPAAAAEREEIGLRVVTEYIDDENLRQQGIFIRWRPEDARRLRWEVAFGTLHEGSKDRLFVSGGPLWRFTPAQDWRTARFVIDFGVNPTLLSDYKFSKVDLGGRFQFTSFLSAGLRFGREQSSRLAVRLQHISNAGIYDRNPGTDQLGVEFSHRF